MLTNTSDTKRRAEIDNFQWALRVWWSLFRTGRLKARRHGTQRTSTRFQLRFAFKGISHFACRNAHLECVGLLPKTCLPRVTFPLVETNALPRIQAGGILIH